jgi:hypothetical protein
MKPLSITSFYCFITNDAAPGQERLYILHPGHKDGADTARLAGRFGVGIGLSSVLRLQRFASSI